MLMDTVLAPGLRPLGGGPADRAKVQERKLDLSGEVEILQHAECQLGSEPTRLAADVAKQSSKGRAYSSTGRVDLHNDRAVQQVPAYFM